jgi:hypothetical protein
MKKRGRLRDPRLAYETNCTSNYTCNELVMLQLYL